MEYNVYCDESCHLVSNDSKYMLIGAVYCPKNKVKKVNEYIEHLKENYNLSDKIKAFNWEVIEIDGHNIVEIYNAIEGAKKSIKPAVIVANTIKGKGVSFMENNAGWHGKAPSEQDYEKAIAKLK